MTRELPSQARLAKVVHLGKKEGNVTRFGFFETMFGKHVVTSIEPTRVTKEGYSYEIKGTSIVRLNYGADNQLVSIDWISPNKRGNHSKLHIEYGHTIYGEYAPNDTRFINPLNSWSIVRDFKDPSDLGVGGKLTVQEKVAPGIMSPKVDKTYNFTSISMDSKKIRALKKYGFDPKYVTIMEMLGPRDWKKENAVGKMAKVQIFMSSIAAALNAVNFVNADSSKGMFIGISLLTLANMLRNMNIISRAEDYVTNSVKNELNMLATMGSVGMYMSTLLYHSLDVLRSFDRNLKYLTEMVKAESF